MGTFKLSYSKAEYGDIAAERQLDLQKDWLGCEKVCLQKIFFDHKQ